MSVMAEWGSIDVFRFRGEFQAAVAEAIGLVRDLCPTM
jgi:hypothetical protein